MTQQEREEKATDIIGMLAAFGTNHEEAKAILDFAAAHVATLNPEQYAETGGQMAAMAAALSQLGKK